MENPIERASVLLKAQVTANPDITKVQLEAAYACIDAAEALATSIVRIADALYQIELNTLK